MSRLAARKAGARVATGAHIQRRRATLHGLRGRDLLRSVPVAMLLVDDAGRIGVANLHAEREFRFPESELLGMPVETVLPFLGCVAATSGAGPHTDGPASLSRGPASEGVGRRKDGSEFPAEITLSPLPARYGSIAMVSVVNVSERNRAAAELSIQRNEIAHLLRVTMLGELSGSFAHELNQPLTAILSNAQAAQRHMSSNDIDMQEIREILADIVEQDKRAGEVIVRVRALLHKGETKHAILDVAQVVADVLRLMRSDLINRGVEALVEAAAPVPDVLGDRVQIQQVLMNLIMNACDAMTQVPRSDRRIVVLIAAEEGEVQVCVRDNGSGMAPGVRDRLFEPFFTTKATGTGLGLPICRTIMEAHGGRIWGTDNTGGGATFCVAMPLAPDGGPCDRQSDRECCR